MSLVSCVILTCWLAEEDTMNEEHSKAINFINAYPHVAYAGTLIPVSQYTNGKHPECLIYIAGYNYLHWDVLVHAIRQAPWNYPDRVQVLWRDSEEYTFKSFSLEDLHNLSPEQEKETK